MPRRKLPKLFKLPRLPRLGEHPDLPFDGDFGKAPQPCEAPPTSQSPPEVGPALDVDPPPRKEPPPRSQPKTPPLWRRALETTAKYSWMVGAGVLCFILWLLWQVWCSILGGLVWLWGEVSKALVAILAKWLAYAVVTLVLLLAALVGVNVVPSSYWPWWFRKYWILERLKPPPKLDPWRNKTEDADGRDADERPPSPDAQR